MYKLYIFTVIGLMIGTEGVVGSGSGLFSPEPVDTCLWFM